MEDSTKKIVDLQGSKYRMFTDPKEIAWVKEFIGANPELGVGCMFVEILDGDYGEIWATETSSPSLQATAYKLK
jgi:hypothetical protein